MAQHVVSRVHTAPEEVFEQGHVIDRKISTQQTQNWHSWNHHPIFHSFPKFENIMCCTRQVIPFWIQAVGFLQLPRSSLRPAGKHSWGEARHRGVNSFISRLSRGLTRGNARVNELGITPCSSCNVICHLRVKSLQGSTNAAQNIFDSIGGSSKRSW